MHVYVGIERRWTFDEVRRAALALAREVERRAPILATSKWWKEERHGVFLDYNQNAKDRTVAGASRSPDAGRARVGAVDLGRSDVCEPGDFTLATMPAVRALGDLHAADGRARVFARPPARSVGPRTSARAWATRRGRRTTGSSRASRAALSPPVARRRHPKHPLIEIGRAER